MNKNHFNGRFTKDPTLRFTPNGKALLKGNIAVYKDKDSATYVSFQAWGNTAELIAKHFKSGDGIIIHCRFENNNYTDKDGNKVYRDIFTADSIDFPVAKKYIGNVNNNSDDVPPPVDDDELPF